jgi:endonuclease/exonuclease/phosphatase family metal-dependent hydrolase
MLILRFCLMMAVALTIAPQLGFIDPRLTAFEAFAPQFALGSLAAFRAASGLENRGFFAPSWTMQLPAIFRIQIDHVFTGGTLAARSLHTGPDVGSDHLPMIAEIELKSQ